MNKFVILFALVATVTAEPPVNYGAVQYDAPVYSYAPVAAAYAYDGGDDGSSYVDDALLARVAQILEQSEGAGYSGGYAQYGAPARSGGVLLGRPERAHRVAEFDLTDSHLSTGYGY